MSEINMKKTGKRIRSLRLERKLTQVKLADKIPVTSRYLCEIENATKPVTMRIINKLAPALGVKVDDIIVYKNNDDEILRDEIQRLIDNYNKKSGLTSLSDIAPENMKEFTSLLPFCVDFGIVLSTIEKLGYKCYPFETKWTNDVVTFSFGNKSFEWDLTKYPKGVKEMFKDDLVYLLLEDEKIVGILSDARIRELEQFFISGLQGVIDGTKKEFNFLLNRSDLSEEEKTKTIKFANKEFSTISDYYDSYIDLLKQIREKVIEIKTKTDRVDD